jgi:hypothetical protein
MGGQIFLIVAADVQRRFRSRLVLRRPSPRIRAFPKSPGRLLVMKLSIKAAAIGLVSKTRRIVALFDMEIADAQRYEFHDILGVPADACGLRDRHRGKRCGSCHDE